MKIVEFAGGIQLPITNEEADLLKRFSDNDSVVVKNQFTDAGEHPKNQLVNKGALLRRNQDGQITYSKQISD